MISKLHVSSKIRYALVDQYLVVVNLGRESYVLFEPVAAAMWREHLACDSRQAAVARLATQYDVEEERVAQDYDDFIGRCAEEGYLTAAPRTPPAPADEGPPPIVTAIPRLLAWRAWWSLLLTTRELSLRGFAHVYEALSGRVPPRLRASQAEGGLRRAMRAFALAENFFHLWRAPDDCLPRSLALFRFLYSLGLPVEHHIGVRLFPFMAHAWVECQGQVLGDCQEFCARLTTVARIPI